MEKKGGSYNYLWGASEKEKENKLYDKRKKTQAYGDWVEH